jgi:hypothetical protein
MKRLLPLVLSCFLLFESSAQSGPKNKQEFTFPDGYKMDQGRSGVALSDSNMLRYNLGFLKGKKPGVYRLPQDNMPCIVPDSSKTVKIRNVWKGPLRIPYRSKPPRIPNPSKPPQNS